MEAVEPSVPTPALAPVPPEATGGAMLMTSPSGSLVRGTTSPDGMKFAGFNEAGAPWRRRRNPDPKRRGRSAISSCSRRPNLPGHRFRRWKDAQTVEYEVVPKSVAGTTKTEVREAKIFQAAEMARFGFGIPRPSPFPDVPNGNALRAFFVFS